jgi:DNA-binding transcriptional LysR family regulator
MSHVLARLRTMIGDALLVRQGLEMVPTERAGELLAPVRHALDQLAQALAPPPAFDPKSARLRVFLATSDYVGFVLLPRVMARLEAEAPGIELRVVSLEEGITSRLSSGAIALALAPVRTVDVREGIYSKKLFDDRFVCVMRRRHPLAKKKLTAARFAAAAHALVAPRGIDDAAKNVGLRRHVAVTVPHFLVAPHLIASRDLVLTLPERVANSVAKPIGLTIVAPPPELKIPSITICALWHERTHASLEHRWVRALLAEEGNALSMERVSGSAPS